MLENELLQAILSSYGEDIVKEKGKKYKELFYKIFPNANSEAFNNFKKDLEKVLAEEKDGPKAFMENRKAMYTNPNIGEILSKNTKFEEKRETMNTDDKTGRLYVPFEIELKPSDVVNSKFDIKHLGVFSNYEKAKKACNTERNCDDAKEGWKNIFTYNEEGFCCGTHCIYSAWFGLDRESMKLSLKIIVIFRTYIDRCENSTFDPYSIFSEHKLEAITNLLKNFEEGKRALFNSVVESIEEILLK